PTSIPSPTEIVVATNTSEAPTIPLQQADVLAPSATPTTDPSVIQVEASNTPQASATSALQQPPTTAQSQSLSGSGSNPPQSVVPGEIPAPLIGLVSDMVPVVSGTFQMGTTSQEVANSVRECVDTWGGACTLAMGEDSAPAHQVTIDPYQIETTEVTYEQYIAFLNFMGPNSHRNGCDGQPCLATRNETDASNVIFDSANYDVQDVLNQHPVAGVTWYGARAYCEAIGRRLPTEAEWERAARGQEGYLYPWGNEFDTERAKTNRPQDAPVGAVPVASYPTGASPFGALDMSGNVAEWVNDWYSPNYYSQPEARALNPQGPPAGTEKVVRGGSWDTPPFFSRTVHRQSLQPNDQALWAGFRCAAAIDAEGGGAAPASNNSLQNLTIGVGTPDPSTLGVTGEETTANAAPTLPPPPTQATSGGNTSPIATLSAG
ncbi:MAG: SUMF1/EgtB/PvdO family nonheme iron enzyme, partial [Burkholderiales bacterium]|nr:SUMF1/EgtB/PvdO family nonheme iron enzyme [Anaerolineae bacterium]